MSEYLKEVALVEYGNFYEDSVNLGFTVTYERISEPTITVVIKDSRERIRDTHILMLHSEREREAAIKGLYFLADTLKQTPFDEIKF